MATKSQVKRTRIRLPISEDQERFRVKDNLSEELSRERPLLFVWRILDHWG